MKSRPQTSMWTSLKIAARFRAGSASRRRGSARRSRTPPAEAAAQELDPGERRDILGGRQVEGDLLPEGALARQITAGHLLERPFGGALAHVELERQARAEAYRQQVVEGVAVLDPAGHAQPLRLLPHQREPLQEVRELDRVDRAPSWVAHESVGRHRLVQELAARHAVDRVEREGEPTGERRGYRTAAPASAQARRCSARPTELGSRRKALRLGISQKAELWRPPSTPSGPPTPSPVMSARRPSA